MNKGYSQTRKYHSIEGISSKIINVVPKKLTLYPVLNPIIYRDAVPGENTKTIFEEVGIMPFEEANPHAHEQLSYYQDLKTEEVSEKEYADVLWDRLLESIYELWDPDKFHLMFASSGYDSRLIAAAVERLYVEKEEVWLGDILFIEADGEAEDFRKNIHAVGWPNNLLYVYNDDASDHEYHRASFDFNTAWEKLNGIGGFPVNFNWEATDWLERRKLIPDAKDRQQFFGYSSNEIALTVLSGKSLLDYFKKAYYQSLGGPVVPGGTTCPFKNINLMEAIVVYGKGHLTSGTGVSKLVLKHKTPPEVYEPRSMIHREKLTTTRFISQTILDGAYLDYRDSWYGKQFPNVIPARQVQYSHWWASWCVASFCEYLLNTGHEIRVGR